jgi:hypothetical protein
VCASKKIASNPKKGFEAISVSKNGFKIFFHSEKEDGATSSLLIIKSNDSGTKKSEVVVLENTT